MCADKTIVINALFIFKDALENAQSEHFWLDQNSF